ncbi:MAG TPA: hypothetical protein DCR14_16620 [Acidimicrobiaceae bacterium]|nr:hypothetical protein [Acidimicrobiaceae bacterium]
MSAMRWGVTATYVDDPLGSAAAAAGDASGATATTLVRLNNPASSRRRVVRMKFGRGPVNATWRTVVGTASWGDESLGSFAQDSVNTLTFRQLASALAQK